MIEETRHPQTDQKVIAVVCDGDPECMDSQYFPWDSGQSIHAASWAMERFGWEVVVKRQAPPLVEAYCPVHMTNPPPVPRLGQAPTETTPYGPGSEGYYSSRVRALAADSPTRRARINPHISPI